MKRLGPQALWSPQPGPQALALQSKAHILGLGGAAGGGKTDALLGIALRDHRRSIIFRREAVQGRSMIDRSWELLGGRARFNGQHSVWRQIPPDNRTLEFGGVKDASDVMKWRGQPHDFIGIDEADMFLESQVRFLLGWNRTATPGQRCRAVLCFNPPASAEGRWLLSFFGPWLDKKHPHPAVPGELRYYAMIDGQERESSSPDPIVHKGETIRPRSRTFVPARVQDNPYLMATDYVSQLQALPEPLRSQLLYGDFAAGVEDDAMQVIPTVWVEAAQARWKPGPPQGVKLSALGVDVARGGICQTVICRRFGTWFELKAWAGSRTPDGDSVAMLVRSALADNHHALVNIDTVGIGASAYDSCRRLLPGAQILAVLSGNPVAATDRAGILRFANVRAYLWWALRELLDPANRHDVALPPSRELLADLTAPRWKPSAGVVIVEPKPDIIKRLGRSPDLGDAVVYSLMMPP